MQARCHAFENQCNIHSRHTTLFQRSSNVHNVYITLYERLNNVLDIPEHIIQEKDDYGTNDSKNVKTP